MDRDDSQSVAANKGKLPNFLCAGVEKCGTTTLYDLLKQHPEVGLSSKKETHFFNTHWNEGLNWYRTLFDHIPKGCQAIGEITPAYHRFDEVIPRIKKTLGGETKIILMLREPRRRAFSHYIHDFANHQEITDLVYKRYLSTTQYSPIVKKYFEAFGRENCLVLIFEEDMLPDQQQLLNKVCNFLNLNPVQIKPVHSNASFLPALYHSPDYNSTLQLEDKNIPTPANSLVLYTGYARNTKVLTHLDDAEKDRLADKINSAVSFIPALKSSIIFEQNVEEDLLALEVLLGRKLKLWREPLGDLQARKAPQPKFIAA